MIPVGILLHNPIHSKIMKERTPVLNHMLVVPVENHLQNAAYSNIMNVYTQVLSHTLVIPVENYSIVQVDSKSMKEHTGL